MNRPNLVPRAVVLAFLVIAALVVSSCEEGGGGMGAGGVGYPARWGGGNGRPPVFAGGPSF